ncbi:MAG: DUF3472 domain-containing protein [Ferruginibacter sp.]
MKKLLAFLLLFAATGAAAQNTVTIPAYTAYAVPAEESTDKEESNMFSVKDGLHNWTDNKQRIQFYFNLRNPGKLSVALLLKNATEGNALNVTVAGSNYPFKVRPENVFSIAVPAGASFKKVNVGTVDIAAPGFYTVVITAKQKTGNTVADIKSLELGGDAIKNIHFNAKERRNAASVHLRYPMPDTMNALSFYNEVTVPAGMDGLYSYYMACGFERGYFGMQVNDIGERRIIFSVWDAGNEAVDRNKVSEANKVQLVAKGEDVFADGFGNEGTGGHSHWQYIWHPGETYKFLVTATIDSAAQTTTYAGYFFVPEWQKWKLIACFKAPKDGKSLRGLYSFSENFVGNTGQQMRKAFFGNQWVRRENGEWKELTQSSFSYDATGKAGDRIDYGAGADDTTFYLWHGGFAPATAKYGDAYSRKATGNKPLIDLYKNADSAKEMQNEKVAIAAFTNFAKDSTWKENGGVYYKITKEGKGNLVKLSDTVVVRYKGQLLNGAVFDETKSDPATFPLNRLIKGWQLGVPFCRQGGSIRLVIPSPLAYSIRNLGKIPPNSVLVFDVDVEAVK